MEARFINIPGMLVVVSLLLLGACGTQVEPIGVLVNRVGMTKELVGPSPQDVAMAGFLSPASESRLKRADVLGDDADELLVEVRPGPGAQKGGVEIRDRNDLPLARIVTDEYLTDFGAIQASRADKLDLALYTYPNEKKGGTFSIIRLPEQERVAEWDEYPPPSRFAVGAWHGKPALFYGQGDFLVAKSITGQSLQKLNAPGIGAFQAIHIGAVDATYTVVLASGSGYTPYHMVAVFDSGGELVFQEQANEHAFRLDVRSGRFAFDIWTRSQQWRYTK